MPMPRYSAPLLTHASVTTLRAARDQGLAAWQGSLDLGRSQTRAIIAADSWTTAGADYPYPPIPDDRTILHWTGATWAPVQRYDQGLIKLVATHWGPPTFEIDGIKMLPTAQVSPWDDAIRKVALVAPRGRTILDTCAGLGYFAAACLDAGAARILSWEKRADVLWLRDINPWSPNLDNPDTATRLTLTHGDIASAIPTLPDRSVDAILHDPPRFGIAGELYSQQFYDQLARVLRPRGRLFHYTGTPNRLTSGRDVPKEVARRLERAGFRVKAEMDGVVGVR
jgi:predicted methyltransferase